MAEKQTTNPLVNEKQELLKASKGTFKNRDNQFFARTQSTPLEDQKKLGVGLKTKLKLASGAFNFPGESSGNLATKFLGANQPPVPGSDAGAPTTAPTATTNGTSAGASSTLSGVKPQATTAPGANGVLSGLSSIKATQPKPLTTATPFTPQTQTQTQPQAQPQPQTQTTPTSSINSLENGTSNTKPADGASTTGSASTSSTSSAGKSSFKSRLKISSSNFTVPLDGTGAPASTDANAKPAGATQAQAQAQPPASTTQAGEWGKKPIEKKATDAQDKKTTSSPSKPGSSYKYSKDKLQQARGLETIPETKAENKQDQAAKTEEAPENKKPEENGFKEVTSKSSKNQDAAAKTEAPATKVETKAEVKPEVPVKEEKEVKKVEEPKPKVEEPKPEPVKAPVEEKQFEQPAKEVKNEVKIEIVIKMTRDELANAIARLAEQTRDKPLPQVLENIRNREIILATRVKPKPGPNDKTNNQFDRRQTPLPVQPQVQAGGDGGFTRGSLVQPVEQAKTFQRIGLTEEELRKKEELSKAAGVWTKSKRGEVDPEEATKKAIKFNLNILTPDNFEKIKEEILRIASEKADNCKRVAEFIIENAWTQKHYVNTYAKLCDYLGKSEKLFFDDGAKGDDKKKKKNDFKLHIMKQIQTVFEDESATASLAKRPVEEMDPEEKSLYFLKRKQRILGNVSFIGELFLEKFIVIGIVRIITSSLLQKFLDEYNTYHKATEKPSNINHEDTLEGLLKFYEIIGQAVEDKEGSKSSDKGKTSNSVANFQKVLTQINSNTPTESLSKLGNDDVLLEDLFKIYNFLLSHGNLSTRLDSLVKNLIYRRENKWQASISKHQGPKTMREIHEEFEREQLETERRVDELKEEFYYQPKPKPNVGRQQSTEVYFQVVQDKQTKQAEETKIDTKTLDIDTSVSFRPNRGKATKDAPSTQTANKKPKVSHDEIERTLKDIYRLANGEEIEDRESPEEETKKLATKATGKETLYTFFRTFYDGRLDAIKKRIFIPNLLLDNNLVTDDDFTELFKAGMHKMFEVSCDYPGSDENFARIFLNYVRRAGNAGFLKKLDFSEDFYQTEEADFVLEFYQDFFRAVMSLLNGEYADVKGQFSQGDLDEFAKRIKLEDYEKL